MARLKATTYEALRALHENHCPCKIGYNTQSWIDSLDIITIQLHGHNIVRLYPSGRIDFSMAGWPTVTTRERINQFIKGRVWQENHVQYYNFYPIDPNKWYRSTFSTDSPPVEAI